MTYWELFISFARANVFGFGGGPALIPLIMREVIEIRGWLSFEEFMDAFAFGNALPSPIATKLAAYVGFSVAGWPGAAVALLGTVLPTMLLMIALFQLYLRFRNNPVIINFLQGVRPAVLALLVIVVLRFIPAAFPPDMPWISQAVIAGIGIGSLVVLRKNWLHPALVVLIAGGVGMLVKIH